MLFKKHLYKNRLFDIDTSEADKTLAKMKKDLTKDQFDRLVYRVLRRTSTRVKTILSNELPKEYHIKKKNVLADIKRPQIGPNAGGGTYCNIPIVGRKHLIGGKTIPARGGRKGWNGIKAGKRYKISAHILKGKFSELPKEMERQGGHPPFRNLSAPQLNRGVFTRSKRAGYPPKNLPIVRVAALAVPQMPVNRSEADVQEDIAEVMMKRVVHEYDQIINYGR